MEQNAADLNAALADRLTSAEGGFDARWREALLAVPRHLFVPDRAWARMDRGDGTGFRIDRAADPAHWLETAYADAVIVTQADDGAGDPSLGRGEATSSLSAPGIVTEFARLLDPRGRILEIGTGTGWTAGLLTRLAGDVVSLEIDPVLAERAIANLSVLPERPEVRVGDAALERPEPGSFDGLHVTCGVTDPPWPWIEALRVGGVGVIPWSPAYGGGHRLRLVRTGPEEAVGEIHGMCGYMMLRSQRFPRGRVFEFLHDWDARSTTQVERTPEELTGPPGAARQGAELLVTALVPGMAAQIYGREGGTGLLLHETGPDARATGSWALLEGGELHARGPRDLFCELVAARARWDELGRPGRERFTLRLTPGGQVLALDGIPLHSG